MARSFSTAYKRLRHNVGSSQLTPRAHDSDCVQSLEYDPENGQMVVNFNKRGSYVYFDIEPWLYAEFNNAASRGTYFNLYVRPFYTNFERIS